MVRMLKWLNLNRPDHPLADHRRAVELINELRGGDPTDRLEEARAYLASLVESEGFRPAHLYEIVDLLDQAAKPHQRKVGAEYIGASRLTRAQDNRLWQAATDFWAALWAAYERCLRLYEQDRRDGKAFAERAPVCAARTMRALSAHYKWASLRYGPIPDAIWAASARAYAFAENEKFAFRPLRVYPVAHGDSSVSQEYLKLLMFGISSADGMLPVQIEIADRAISWFSRAFIIQNDRADVTTHYVDLATHRPPARLSRSAAESRNRRYFGAAAAHAEIVALMKVVRERGVVPVSVRVSDQHTPELVYGALQHLMRYWGPKAPARRSERQPSVARLMVIPGFRGAVAGLHGAGNGHPPRQSDTESWVCVNESDGGYGALIRKVRGDWVKLGALVAIKPEALRQWGAGVIRRISRDSDDDSRIGIQLLAKWAVPVRIALVDEACRPIEPSWDALLLSTRPNDNGEVDMVVCVGVFSGSRRYSVAVRERSYLLEPAQLLEAGDDYDLVRFRVWQRKGA
jgi:hypothetical protein